MDIKITDQLTEAELERLFRWDDDVFGEGGALTEHFPWQPKNIHIVCYENEQAASHVGMLQHTVKVNDQPISVGGIGGVITHPEHQGKGFAKVLMKEAENYFKKKWHLEFGMLFCFDRLLPFYKSMGWQHIQDDVYVFNKTEKVIWTDEMMVLPLTAKQWPKGDVDIDGYFW